MPAGAVEDRLAELGLSLPEPRRFVSERYSIPCSSA